MLSKAPFRTVFKKSHSFQNLIKYSQEYIHWNYSSQPSQSPSSIPKHPRYLWHVDGILRAVSGLRRGDSDSCVRWKWSDPTLLVLARWRARHQQCIPGLFTFSLLLSLERDTSSVNLRKRILEMHNSTLLPSILFSVSEHPLLLHATDFKGVSVPSGFKETCNDPPLHQNPSAWTGRTELSTLLITTRETIYQ